MFEGLIALREPSKSWIARWQRIDGFKKGMYAVKVSGNVSFPEAGGGVWRFEREWMGAD